MDVRAGVPSDDTTAVGPMGMAVLPERRWVSLSPINKRRWDNFKANRRGYISLWIFTILFVV